MVVVHLPDELRIATDRQARDGRASSAAAFVQEAILWLIPAGIADVEAARYVTVASPDDGAALHRRMMAQRREALVGDP